MNLRKITDISKERQTQQLKLEIYNIVKVFVYKLWRVYYPQFKGEVDDLVVDIYAEFMRPKKHRNGEIFSELDRFEETKLGGEEWKGDDKKKLIVYLQNYVRCRLMDKARTDKGEINYSETYDEKTGDLSLNYLAKLVNEESETLEDFEITPDVILEARDKYDEMSPEKKKEFLKLYFKHKDNLPHNLQLLFKDLVGSDKPEDIKVAPKSKGGLSKDIQDIEQDLRNLINGATIDTYKLQGNPAVRIIFSDPQQASSLNKEQVDELLATKSYKPYVTRSKVWYYINN